MKKTALSLLVFITIILANSALASSPILWKALIEEDINYISYSSENENGSLSEIVTSTVSASATVERERGPSGFISLLYEQGATPLEVDQAYIFQKFQNYGFTLGQHYLPFGKFQTKLANDPLTLEIAEIRTSALNVDYQVQNLRFHTYAYNGEKQPERQDRQMYLGLRMAFSKGFSSNRIHTQIDYISDLNP